MNRHSILLILGGMCIIWGFPAFGEANNESTTDKVVPIDVQADGTIMIRPGPFEIERKQLLARIYAAKKTGIGINSYLDAFMVVEQLVEKKQGEEMIRRAMIALDDGLYNQVLPLRYRRLRTKEKMTLDEAREYVVKLINADRAEYQLQPVKLDLVASKAGQTHTDEMVLLNYCAHWDASGKKPWQRYTEAGGVHSVAENLALHSCNGALVNEQTYPAEILERIQVAFMIERPPADGHRLNVLRPEHNRVGIGLSQQAANVSVRIALAQEFVDDFGYFEQIPNRIYRGKSFVVSGNLAPGLRLDRVEVSVEPLPRPMTRDELAKTHSCGIALNHLISYH